jgi:hypothetical protein
MNATTAHPVIHRATTAPSRCHGMRRRTSAKQRDDRHRQPQRDQPEQAKALREPLGEPANRDHAGVKRAGSVAGGWRVVAQFSYLNAQALLAACCPTLMMRPG